MDSDRGGSSPIVIRGMIAVVSAVVLVFLLVFVTNRDALRRRQTGGGATDNAAGTVTVTSEGRQTEFGVQIGNDLKAFVADDSFFDDAVQQREPYSEEEIKSVEPVLSVEDGAIAVRVIDAEGTVVSGEMFTIAVVRQSGNAESELLFVDDDKDGVIRVHGLTDGRFSVALKEMEGYRVPEDVSYITVGNVPETESLYDGENAVSGEQTETGGNGGTDHD